MIDELDDDGQPLHKAFNWNRIKDSRMDELIGICRGILADGAVVIEEAMFLRDWLQRNKQVKHTLAGKMLTRLLDQVLADGILSEDEEALVVDMLAKIIGGTPAEEYEASYSTTLPVNDPQPELKFNQHSYCFTGKFQFGTRKQCQQISELNGAIIHSNPNHKTNYLVIGVVGSRDWIHSTGGRKIEKAISFREEGTGIAIVSEAHWCKSVTEQM